MQETIGIKREVNALTVVFPAADQKADSTRVRSALCSLWSLRYDAMSRLVAADLALILILILILILMRRSLFEAKPSRPI